MHCQVTITCRFLIIVVDYNQGIFVVESVLDFTNDWHTRSTFEKTLSKKLEDGRQITVDGDVADGLMSTSAYFVFNRDVVTTELVENLYSLSADVLHSKHG